LYASEILREFQVVIIRTFSEGILSEVSTWGIADGLNTTGVNKADNRIQINLILTDDTRQKRQVTKSKGDASFHFVSTTSENSQQDIKDILLVRKIVGLTKLLTDREIGVLKELHKTRNTKTAANNLHISARTFANHRFNITKKLGMPALEAADFVYECTSVEVFTSMLEQLTV
jgi:DNA-binding CsgD family transcriptional regulator